MKRLFILCAVVLIATGCQKVGSGTSEATEAFTQFHQTDLASQSLPAITKDVLLFATFPPAGSNTNLFLHTNSGGKPFLPKGYYYVPAANSEDIKPAFLPDTLLVQKGAALSFFNTKNQQLTSLKGISVPTYATVLALNSMTGGSSMLVALVDRDQVSNTPHPSILYRINTDTAVAERVTNPLSDNLSVTSNRYPIGTALYDGLHDRLLQPIFREGVGDIGIRIFSLTSGSRAELTFPEPSAVSVTHSYLTVYPRDNSKRTISIVDVGAEKLALSHITVPEYTPTVIGAFMTYSYLGKGFLVGLEYMPDNSVQFTMMHEQQDGVFKSIHAASLPYTSVKIDNGNNLYMVLSSPELLQTRIAQYNILSNTFTGMLTVPGVPSGEIEFLR